MSAVAIEIELRSHRAQALLKRIRRGVGDRSVLHQMIAVKCENLTRDYLRVIATESHKTADRLGATPTGHLERAAENVTSRSDADSATVGVTNPGITRAFRPLIIRGRPFLTIPVAPEAYGRTAASLERALGVRFFCPLKKGAKASDLIRRRRPSATSRVQGRKAKKLFAPGDRKRALAARVAGKLKVYYTLAAKVNQPQDRTLLPSQGDYLQEAGLAAAEYIKQLAGVRDRMGNYDV